MNEQMILLELIIFATVVTIFMYFWKAKKQIEYKGDERWQLIQLKATKMANVSLYIPVILLCVVSSYYSLTNVPEMTFTFRRVNILFMLYFGLHNFIELLSLIYYNKRL